MEKNEEDYRMKIIEKSQKPKKHPEEATERGSASPEQRNSWLLGASKPGPSFKKNKSEEGSR